MADRRPGLYALEVPPMSISDMSERPRLARAQPGP